MCLEGHMWISFLSSSHSADLQTAQTIITGTYKLAIPCSLQTCDQSPHEWSSSQPKSKDLRLQDWSRSRWFCGSVASPPMTLLDHNVDEFPRVYWTYSPRNLHKNHNFNRTVTNWGPCHDNKIEVLLFQRPSQNMEQKYRCYLRLWANMKCEANKLCCCWSSFFTYKTRQYQNIKTLQKKSASQKKQPWSCHVQKKPTELAQSLNSTVPRLKRETRFWTRRQWRPKNRTTKVSGLSLMWS